MTTGVAGLVGLRIASAAEGDAQTISGVAFRDYDQDGVRDTREPGIPNVTVTAVCESDTDANPATPPVVSTSSPVLTANDPDTMYLATTNHGKYTINVKQGKCRLEFTSPSGAAYLFPAKHGTNNASTVQFVTVGTTAVTGKDVSFSNPSDYCVASGSNPNLAVTVMCNGDPLAGGSTGNYKSLVTFSAASVNGNSASGQVTSTNYDTTRARAAQTGSVYGVAYSAKRNLVYSAAYVFRHMGLGLGGIDAIYATDPTATTGASIWLDGAINTGSISSNSARGLPANGGANHDSEAFPLVNVMGYGDIDIDDADQTLYVTNLYDRKIYPIDLDSKAVAAPLTVPDPGCADGALARPFALEFHDGKLYAGTTCTGEAYGMANPTGRDNSMLSAHVYAYDPAAGTWGADLLNVPLNYTRGYVDPNQPSSNKFYAWTDVGTQVSTWPTTKLAYGTTYQVSSSYFNDTDPRGFVARSMPILSDLEFDWDGSMILTLGDRQASMFGYLNYGPSTANSAMEAAYAGGEILRAAPPAVGGTTYRLENNGTMANGISGGVANGQGIGGGEFYSGDGYKTEQDETTMYSSEYVPGMTTFASTRQDWYQYSQGLVGWYTNQTGQKDHAVEIYYWGDNTTVALQKQNGLGDLEALCGEAPLEIGNRVWFDADKDGTQDPSEVPIVNVTVRLVNAAGTTVATTTTDATGNYWFNATPNTAYKIVFDTSTVSNFTGMTGITAASQLMPTTQDTGTSNTVDSDMVAATKTINYTTTLAGQDNHTLDAGFTPTFYDLALRKTVDTTKTSWPLSPGDTVTFNIDIFNQGAAVARINVADYIDTAVWDAFDPVLNPSGTTTGDQTVAYSWNATDTAKPVLSTDVPLAQGQKITVPITLRIKAGYAGGDLINWAEISNFDNNTNTADGDAASGAITDIDSTPDATNHSNGPETLGSGMIDNEITASGKAAGDEDDHDLAQVHLLDLALRKTVASAPDPLEAGGKVTFNIEVFNQGSTYANGIELTDYIDPAFWESFAAADNADGNTTGDHTYPYTWASATGGAKVTITGSLAPGESIIVPITLTVKAGVTGQLDNLAEISKEVAVDSTGTAVLDPNGDALVDSDSTPDATNSDTLVDDVIDNTSSDEDDHDIASVTATAPPPTTTTTTTTTTEPPTTTTTTTEPPTTTTTTTEPPTTTTTTTEPPTTTTTTTEPPTTTTTTTEPPTTTTTTTEPPSISTTTTTTTEPPTTTSTTEPPTTTSTTEPPTTTSTTEPPTTTSTTEPPTTTTTTAPPGTFDLALQKVLAEGQPELVHVGEAATFTITVINQGSVDGTDVAVTDFIPAGLELADADWTASDDGTSATYGKPFDLAVGKSIDLDITFLVTDAASEDGALVNWAEISAATGPDGKSVTDIDSTPNAENHSETGEIGAKVIDDNVDGNGKDGGDEDDHDPASLTLEPGPATTTTTTTTTPSEVEAATVTTAPSTVPESLGFVESVVKSVPRAITGGSILPLLMLGAGLVFFGLLLHRRKKNEE